MWALQLLDLACFLTSGLQGITNRHLLVSAAFSFAVAKHSSLLKHCWGILTNHHTDTEAPFFKVTAADHIAAWLWKMSPFGMVWTPVFGSPVQSNLVPWCSGGCGVLLEEPGTHSAVTGIPQTFSTLLPHCSFCFKVKMTGMGVRNYEVTLSSVSPPFHPKVSIRLW